ncbi:MAG: hypothetical protein HYR87_07800 [Thaumarchaeota archaeon]|nr:hypothetical protein [Nitrososphaerota archaeon]
MGKKKLSTVEVKERKTDGDTTTLSINLTIPTKLFHIAEALEEVGRIDSIEKNFESSIENYYEKIYQIIAPEKKATGQPTKKKSKKPEKAEAIIEKK